MAVRVEVEGIGPLEFEDGTTPDVIQATVKRLVSDKSQSAKPAQSAPAEQSNWDTFKRNLGLGTRDAIEGVGQLPGMFVDAVNLPINLGIRGVNAAAGTSIPTMRPAKEGFTAAADAIGLPTPETSGEKIRSQVGQNIAGLIPTMGAGAALQGGGKASQFIGNALTAAPASQVLGAAGAGVAGEIAKQQDVGPFGQFGAALAGGIAGASLPALGGMAARGLSSLVQPFSAGGREKIVGEALLRNSSDPETLAQRLVTGADDETRRLPGSPVTSAVAARDPQMLMLESGLRSDVQTAPGVMSPAAALRDVEATRNANRGATINALIRGEADNPTARGDVVRGAMTDAEKAMKARTNQMYTDAASDQKFSVRPILDALDDSEKQFFGPLSGGMPAELKAISDDLRAILKPPPEAVAPPSTAPVINLSATPLPKAAPKEIVPRDVDWDALQNLYSRAGVIKGNALAGPQKDNRVAAVAGQITKAIDDLGASPAWDAARAQRRAQGAALGRDAAGGAASGAILRRDNFGAPMITSDAAIKKALESPQAAKQIIAAAEKGVADAKAAGLPTAELASSRDIMRQTMRDQFADNLQGASRTTSDIADAAGNVSRQLSPAQFTRFWEKNRRIADVLFDGAERRTLDRLAADFAETSVVNTARARGSDTAQNLSVGNFIAKLTNGVIDPQNPLAQSLGNLGPVAGWITRAPEQAMREMLVQAIRDPKFAAQLVEKAGPESLQRAMLYFGQAMPQRLQDTAMGALAREVPRLGMSDATGSPTPKPRLTGR